jgi:hypothetical protein
MAKKKFDPKAKAKRQKIIAAVGGVVLLGVLSFQVPRTLKMLHQSNASASATTTTTSTTGSTNTTGPIAPPSLGGGNATASSASNVSSDGVSDPDVLPNPQSGQLLAFSRFRSKDPFSQQLELKCASGSGSTGGSVSCPATTPTGASGKTTAPPAGTNTTVPSTPAAKLTSAVISINGVPAAVGVGNAFPASNPSFQLVSLTKTTAKIGIAGGSLESGHQTVTLKKNVALTLMNTADGTRYTLKLLSVK